MATAAVVLLLLATLVALGRPSAPLTARALPGAALRGALVLDRLSDRRRGRLLGWTSDPCLDAVVAAGARADERPRPAPGAPDASAPDRAPAPC